VLPDLELRDDSGPVLPDRELRDVGHSEDSFDSNESSASRDSSEVTVDAERMLMWEAARTRRSTMAAVEAVPELEEDELRVATATVFFGGAGRVA